MTEKTITIEGEELHFKSFTSENAIGNILIVHGWGGKSDSWLSVAEILHAQNYNVYVPDLPGFGKSPLKKTYTIPMYAQLLEDFVKEEKLDITLLLGHSNGGAIATQIVVNENIKIPKLILNNSAGVRLNGKRKIKRIIMKPIVLCFKLFSFLPFYSVVRQKIYTLIGSADYIQSEQDNPHKKATYLNMIGSDMKDEFQTIRTPTLLLWGENDTMTPLSDAANMRANIKDSELVVIENQGHSIHMKNPIELSKNILEFLK